jgi:cytochrome c oxidase cbb3-type subunit 2
MKNLNKLYILLLLGISILIYLLFTLSAKKTLRTTDKIIGNKTVNESQIKTTSDLLSQGKNIYSKYCIACHGADGKGDGPEAYRLNTKPTDFTSGNIKFKSTPYGTKPTIGNIVSTLKLGVRTTAMLPQRQLNGEQMNAVALYVISFMPEDQKRGKPIEIANVPSMNDTLLKEGENLFEINCASCHGKDAGGNGALSKKLTDYKQNPIHPANLTLRPLKRANTPEWMYMIISTGIEGTPMPPFQQVLKSRKRWAVVDFVESLKSGYRSSNNNGMMGGMMKHRFVGEEFKGMQIDMAAAHALMMGR